MITLFDNPFSPFARKVRLVLRYKNLPFQSLDSLAVKNIATLKTINPRGEVPVLIDGDITVINSADIIAYLEDRYPEVPVLPKSPAQKVQARQWQRLADTLLDAIIHDISIWTWPMLKRTDLPPPGLIEVGLSDLTTILSTLDQALQRQDFLCGTLSIADLAVFPHISGLKVLGVALDAEKHLNISAWFGRIRALDFVKTDQEHIKKFVQENCAPGLAVYESQKIVWRGDRIEWLFLKGFHEWWLEELRCGRVLIPVTVPT